MVPYIRFRLSTTPMFCIMSPSQSVSRCSLCKTVYVPVPLYNFCFFISCIMSLTILEWQQFWRGGVVEDTGHCLGVPRTPPPLVDPTTTMMREGIYIYIYRWKKVTDRQRVRGFDPRRAPLRSFPRCTYYIFFYIKAFQPEAFWSIKMEYTEEDPSQTGGPKARADFSWQRVRK